MLIETLNLPVVPLRDTVILPEMVAHFDINRRQSVLAIEQAMKEGQEILLALQKDPETDSPGFDGLYDTGVYAKILQVVRLTDGLLRVLAEGRGRVRILQAEMKGGMLLAEAEVLPAPAPVPGRIEEDAYLKTLRDLFSKYAQEAGGFGKELYEHILSLTDLHDLSSQLSANMNLTYLKKQRLLEEETEAGYAEALAYFLTEDITVNSIRRALQEKIRAQIDKNQKEYILREQLKVIEEELGEDGEVSETDRLLEECGQLNASEEVKEAIRKEIGRYKRMGAHSAENTVARGYIDTLLAMPWDNASVDSKDMARAREILERDHYGLTKVKERVLEFLAVRQLTEKGRSPILCLVGPPGTGKTSIGKSIAEALDKKYTRIALGGVHDEAEIRGHRRTYVGAMPGRIAALLKQTGVKNPLMVLDEVDKVGSDMRGDVSSALLEVLDGEQNSRFADHYIEIPIDLSEVLFLATANTSQTIPAALRDRMEIIEVPGYTDNEKLHIAKEHLVKKTLAANGLNSRMLRFTDAALEKIIREYTREAGVRQLERRIGEICRKAALLHVEEGKAQITVGVRRVAEFLGKPLHVSEKKNDQDMVGIVRGLAWTQVGGVTLEVEAGMLPGSGKLVLTGQMGDVMKESAQAALTWVRSAAGARGVKSSFFKARDLHIHIPEGAVPKDGPSAGITMATAILSAVTGEPVRADVAMTGEVTLTGRVLPIGGLREKLLAAKQAGIFTVLVPDGNRKDIDEVDAEIKDGMELVFVKNMDKVVRYAFRKMPEARGAKDAAERGEQEKDTEE